MLDDSVLVPDRRLKNILVPHTGEPPEHERFTDIFDILPELWAEGFRTVAQDGRWHLFRKDGEGILDADTFYGLCKKITEWRPISECRNGTGIAE